MIDQDVKDLIEKLVAEQLEAGKPAPVSSKDNDDPQVIGRNANGKGTVRKGGAAMSQKGHTRRLEYHAQKRAIINGAYRRFSGYGKSQAEALKHITAKVNQAKDEAERQTKKHAGLDLDQTVGQYLDRWCTSNSQLSPNSVASRQWAGKAAKPYIGHIRLDKLTGIDLENMIASVSSPSTMRRKGMGQNSLNRLYRQTNKAFEDAIIRGLITSNPWKQVPPSDRPQPKQKITQLSELNWLTPEERNLLLSVNDRWTPLFTLLAYYGMRIGEALALTWDRVDFDKKQIRVDRNAIHPSGMGKMLQDFPKTAASNRIIPMIDVVEDALKKQRDLTGNFPLVFPREKAKPNTPEIECVMDSGRPLRVLRSTLKALGIDKNVGNHKLRDTAASLMVKGGGDIKGVSHVLGHSDVRTTYNVYVHTDQEMLADALNAGADL